MQPHTFLTAGEAAKLTGKSVTTITRSIKSGRISGVTRGDKNEYKIDPSALFNVFPMLDKMQGSDSRATAPMQQDETPKKDTGYEQAIEALKTTIAGNEKLIELQEKMLEDYKARLTKSENLLTDQQKKAEATPEKKGFLARLFG